MAKLRIAEGEWVVVCDGAKALVLENVGDPKFLNLKTKEVYEQDDPKTSEQGTDAPGRTINSVNARRSAMEQTDWHDQAEQRFLQGLAAHLDAAVNAGKVKSLIVVAPPRALGVLRQAFPTICAPRCAPRSTRISSSFRCTRSKSTSPLKLRRLLPAPSAACRHCRRGSPHRPCRARATR
jgi:protein required for attachment to host cells